MNTNQQTEKTPTNKDIIDHFFKDNYQILTKKCQDYASVYNYKLLQPDEILSELYLFTLSDQRRINKLAELIQLTAYTLNKTYNYNIKALYYISRILYNVIHGHRSFTNNSNKINHNIKIEYNADVESIGEDISDEEYQEILEYDIEKIALNHAHGDNWWQYRLFFDHYINHMTFKELSIKYNLTISPIFSAVKNFKSIIIADIQKEISENTCL